MLYVPTRRRQQAPASLLMVAVVLVSLLAMLAPVQSAFAAPILVLKIELAPGTPNPVDTGARFRYRLTYECSGTLASEVCTNMQVQTDPLPAMFEGIVAIGNSDVTLANFDPATRRATWDFKSPLAPGSTGQLEFEVRFVPGTTVDGATGQINTTITAVGRTPVTIISPPITANAVDDTSALKTIVRGGAADDITTYSIKACAGSQGALDFENVTVIDTLPLGATYVSSNPPATVDTSGPTPVLTWSGATVNAGSCEDFLVTVNYPKATNPVGSVRTNTATVSGTPHGSATVRTIPVSVTHTLANPIGGMTFLKSADADTIIGGLVVTSLTLQNTGNVTLQNVVIDDPLPNEYNLQSIDTSSATAVSYQKNGAPIWYSSVALGANIAVNSANFPGFTAGDYVSALRFTLGTVPVGGGDSGIRLRTIAINPAHGSATPYTLPHYATNTAVAHAEVNGTPLTDKQDGATTEIETPKARPTPQKSVVIGSAVLPGEAVRYRLDMNNGSFLALDEPVVADLLPAALDYQAGSWSYTPIAACPSQPAFQAIPDYGGSARTLLVWSWAGSGCKIPSSEGLPITFDVRVKPDTYPTSALPNRFALVNYSTPSTLVRTQRCDSAPAEASFFSTDAATGVDKSKLCWSPPSNVRVNAAASIASAKQVKGQLDAAFHRDPKTGQTVQGGLITYSIALTNTGNVDFADLRIQDILPYDLPAPGNVSVRNQTPLGTAWTPQLAGPVIISPPIPGLKVRYSTETNPCRPELASPNPGCTPMRDEDDPGPGIWSLNLPTDPTAVRSLRFHFNSYVLKANESVTFTFPMFAPVDAPISAAGLDGISGTDDDANVAWNTFAYSAVRTDDGSTLVAQPPRVGITVQPIPPGRASLGDYVWNDVDQNGSQNEPPFRGMNGVVVDLFQPGPDGTPGTGDDLKVGTTVTRPDSSGDPGYYLFPALMPGDYFVRFTPSPGYTVTTRDAGADDTKDSDADASTDRTGIITLNPGDDNRTVDAGMYAPVVSIGNRVWFDTNNNSQDDDGSGGAPGSSIGIQNVAVDLFQDVNGDGGLTGAERTPIANQLTDTNGFYRFDAQTHVNGTLIGSPVPLYPGSYIVGIRPSNFASGGALVSYHSSGTVIDMYGNPADAIAPDPDVGGAPANPGVDRDENGDKQSPLWATFYVNGVLSKAAYVLANEPIGEPEPAGIAPGGITIDDQRSNLTVDFGFYTASVGDVVWLDDGAGGGTRNNGVREAGEAGLAGATVRLYTVDGLNEIPVGPDGVLGTADDAIGGIVTPASGAYLFSGLPQGRYVVKVTPPAGYASSKDIAGQTGSPDGNHNSDDNGIGALPGQVTSAAFDLTPGAVGALSNNIVTTAIGTSLNPTIDFGFVRYYSLGNRVWADQNNSGDLDGGEIGISGVTLRLFASDGVTRAKDIAGTDVTDATTDGNGYYRFDNLLASDYIVEVQAGNFTGPLNGRVSSTGALQQPNPNTDAETDDNGLDTPVAGAIRSSIITLGEGSGAVEPTTDTDGGAIASGEAPDNQSNRTLDFGFFEPLSIGNRVWDDRNNDGRINVGETGMQNVTVRLFADTNNDNLPDGAALASMLTNATGHYLFTMLQPGDYIVEIDAPAGYRTSTGNFNAYEPAPDPDSNSADSDDNGSLVGAVVRSKTVTLTRGGEPTGEAASTNLADPARDNNSNAAVDFGLFQPLSIGNRVWRDANNNGTIDAADGATPGIGGVTVRLYRDSNNDGVPDDANGVGGVTIADAIKTTTTDVNGFYLFIDVGADTYVVDAVTPAGYATSTGKTLPTPYETNVPDPDTDIDHDDNGAISGGAAAAGVARSKPVTVALTTEPTGEGAMAGYTDPATDNSANYTVDFGFYETLSLGNRVWLDADNSGTVNGAETGINGVTVRLYRDSNDDGAPDDLNGVGGVTTADAIKTTTTNSTGHYLFTGLDEDTYIVEVAAPAGYRGSTGPANAFEPGPDADTTPTDNDDNGTGATGTIRSQPVTLALDTEPIGEGATPSIADTAADNRSNVTVDFGLWRPVNLGDLIFEDGDNSGAYSGAVDRPLAGAVVSLFLGDGTTPARDVIGALVPDQTTTGTGLYNFTNLPPGDYVVKVTAPASYRSSTDIGTSLTPNGNTNNDDNGVGVGNAVASSLITLTSGGEPTSDGDGSDGNLTLDFGFWHPVSLGNLVFQDNDDNAVYNPAIDDEVENAVVSLFLSDGITPARDVNGALVPSQTTLSDGLYNFTNLPPGGYIVKVTALAGYRSSTDIVSTGNPNGDANNDDNGVGTGANVASLAITLTSGGEPNAASDGDDVHGNTTLDFGFVLPVSLGNLVWDDTNNNALSDSGEQPILGATVALFKADGVTPAVDVNGTLVPSQNTIGDGLYSFTNLRPGAYVVKVTPPAGYVSSKDIAATITPDGNADNDDNGEGTGVTAQSRPITLTRTAEPNTPADEDDTNGNTTLDFGFVRVYSLGNRVWFDADNSGAFDTGEVGISGVTVRLFKADGSTRATTVAGATVPDATADASGYYRFDSLPPGDYIVELQAANFGATQPLEGMRSSTGALQRANPNTDIDADDNGLDTLVAGALRSGTVTLGETPGAAEPTTDTDGGALAAGEAPNNQSNRTLDFGLFRPVNLGNLVFEDGDNSGTYGGATDRPLAGAVVSLFLSDGVTPARDVNGALVPDQTTTGTGLYNFTNLSPGDYIVKVTAPAGYRGSTGPANAYEPGPDADTTVADNRDRGTGLTNVATSQPVTLTSGGEPATAVDTDGSDGNLTLDFGFWHPVSLGNLVFEDLNGDGQFTSSNDRPLAGALVSLFLGDGTTPARDVAGALVPDQTTTGTGLYSFTNLSPGGYIVKVSAPAGYTSSADLLSTTNPDGDIDNDDNGEGLGNVVSSRALTLVSLGEPNAPADEDDRNGNTTLDFGFVQPVSLGNLVFEDGDNSGTYGGATDRPLAGAVVSLFLSDGVTPARDVNGALVPSQTTTGTGLYNFTNLSPGDYVVKVTAPAGYRSSTDIASTGNPNGDADNDDNGVGGGSAVVSQAITLVREGEPAAPTDEDGDNGNTTLDFGFWGPVSLGDFVWYDVNGNGIQDAGETGLAGVTVTLYNASGATPIATDATGNAINPIVTTGSGAYSFGNLPPGQYTVKFSTIPPGYLASQTGQGTSATDSNGISAQSAVLASGQSDLTLDSGFFQPASIGDTVWLDSNNDGIQNNGEAGIPGLSVQLYQPGGDGVAGTGDDVLIASTSTGSNGDYQFINLIPGDYFVRFDPLLGYALTLQDVGGNTAGSDLNDSDADVVTGRTVVTTLAPGENDPSWDAGLYFTASLGDRIWLDQNANGIQDAGEAGLPGITVLLLDNNGLTIATTVTDANGNYGFSNLSPGQYSVQVTPPAGYVVSPIDRGADNNADSDIDVNTYQTSSIIINFNTVDPSWDAGLYRLVSLGNQVWSDYNNNGQIDATETGIDGVLVNLYQDTNTNGVLDIGTDVYLASFTTSGGGKYLFDQLTPNTFLVQLDPANFVVGGPLQGYTSSTGSVGSTVQPNGPYEPAPDPNADLDNADDGSIANQAIVSGPITLASGSEPTIEDGNSDTNLTIDFGVFQPGRLGNTVWEDTNRDGMRDPGELGIAGVTVTLYDANGVALITVTTDASGFYQFVNLPPSDYTVGFSNLPAGYIFTMLNAGSDVSDSDADPSTGLSAAVTIQPGDSNVTIFAGLVPVPTAVTLTRFNAAMVDGHMVVAWTTGMEFQTWGFQLYRSATGQRADATLVTPGLIPAQGRGGNGADYQWIDPGAKPGVAYQYWLVEVEINGTTNEYGPARVTTPMASWRVYLPIVAQ